MTVVAAFVILLGSGLALLASVGLFRLPEVYGRMHAATKPAVLGFAILVIGTAIELNDISATARLLLAGGLQLFTAPVAMHTVGRAVGRTASWARQEGGWPPADGSAPEPPLP